MARDVGAQGLPADVQKKLNDALQAALKTRR